MRSTAEADRSTPPGPSVRVPAPVTPIADAALATLIPLHELEVPSVRPAPSEVPDQVATSPAPGTVPPQLAPVVRSAPVGVFVIVAACDPVAKPNKSTKSESTRQKAAGRRGAEDFIG